MPGLDGRYIADRLLQIQKKRGLTTKEFGQLLGFSPTTLDNYLYGVNQPVLKNLIQIANSCRVSLDWLCSEPSKETLVELFSEGDSNE